MDLHLTGKTALVLAASKGLGKACAAALVAEGADVVIGARDRTVLEAAAKELAASGKGRVLAIPVDVLNPKQSEEIVAATVEAFGKVDILVNNAGGPPYGRFETFDDAAWKAAFELTLLSAVRFSRLVIPHMRKAGGGRIINIVSLTVRTSIANSVLSTSLRLGVTGMAKMLSNELGPDNITVNNVAPGLFLTDRVKDIFPPANPSGPTVSPSGSSLNPSGSSVSPSGPATLEEMLAQRVKDIPVGRIGTPSELGPLVAFLASPLSGYITGATIPIDGGASRGTT